ncbi:MAG TPA: HEAT repeat domain-containing protein, partial [Caulifigura sp.]|nr:HEAT repeat domain-containing protein [Caulifigura sp.]
MGRQGLILAAWLFASAAWSASALAIDPAKAPVLTDTASITEAAFLERLARIEQTLQRDGAPPLFPSRPAVIPLTHAPALDTTNAFMADGVPFVATMLQILNTTNGVQTLDPASITLTADGKQVRFSDVPAQIHGFVIEVAGRGISIEDCLPRRPIPLAAGKVTSIPILFAPVDSRSRVPVMTLQMHLANKPVQLDLNRLHNALLDARVSRVGPAGACGLVTIDGAVDGINAGLLAERVSALNTAGVRRFAIGFGAPSTPPSQKIMGWLATMAIRGEIGDLYRNFPTLPSDVAELQFAGVPESVSREFADDSRAEQHEEIEAAVRECLWAPYRKASRRDVIVELDQGDPRGRAAALACGAQHYREEDLPRLLRWMEDPSRAVRRAACGAVAGIDSPSARETLKGAVVNGSPRSAEAALTAMLSARSAATVSAGVEVAEQANSLPEAHLTRILIESRNPAFAERIRTTARTGGKEARLLAINVVAGDRSGDVPSVFADAFAATDRDVRDAALTAAATRLEHGDQRLRSLAVNEALRRLRANPSDPVPASIAALTRDPRFVPILATRLATSGASPAERTAAIERLVQIGGSEATESLVRAFDSLMPMQQELVLGHLWREDPARALPFAEKLIASPDSSLSERARKVLVHDGSDRSVASIRQAIRGDTLPHRDDLLLALAAIGSPAAFDALFEFRESGDEDLRWKTEVAFANYWARSPAYEIAETASQLMERSIPASPADVAESMTLYDSAIELDRVLPNIYRGRGNAHLRQQHWAEAAADFEAAMELNPYDELAITGSAIAWIMLDRQDEALGWIAEASHYFERGSANTNYAYNSACAYSRALE